MGEVKVVESSMVTPSEKTPKKGLWLSPLDVMCVNRGHTPTVYLYSSDSGAGDDFFDVTRLKASMAKALVAFYPLAGRLSMDADGRAEIDCAGQGARFVVAHSDLTVDDLGSFHPSPELRRLFVPSVVDTPSIICAIQVTFLKLGGVILGTAVHHVANDAISAFHFFQTWSTICKDGDGASPAALQLPCHDRTLLRARSPPVVHPDALTVFCPTLRPSESSVPLVNEIFLVSKDQVAALKRACIGGNDGGRVSTFAALSAHVWRCLCVARRLPPDATTRLTFTANVRRSLKPPLPDSYYGNGIIMVGTEGKVHEIHSEGLASVAGRIGGTVRKIDDEVVRSVIDYLEMAGSRPVVHAGGMPETELMVVSWLGMPMYEADFGWGKPLAMQLAAQQRDGFFHLMDGVGGRDPEGSIRILTSMEATIRDDFRRLLFANI